MNTETYNPEVHCCRYWYKDYCECLKAYLKESRDQHVNDTLSFLKKNKINFIESKIPNVVIVNPQTDNVSVSLKRKNNLLMCRYSGSNKWYTFTKQKFVDTFTKT